MQLFQSSVEIFKPSKLFVFVTTLFKVTPIYGFSIIQHFQPALVFHVWISRTFVNQFFSHHLCSISEYVGFLTHLVCNILSQPHFLTHYISQNTLETGLDLQAVSLVLGVISLVRHIQFFNFKVLFNNQVNAQMFQHSVNLYRKSVGRCDNRSMGTNQYHENLSCFFLP